MPISIVAVLVVDKSGRVVRGEDGLPDVSRNSPYRSWLRDLVRGHEVLMGEKTYRKFERRGIILPCARHVVLAKQENISVLQKTATWCDPRQNVAFIPKASLLGTSANFSDIFAEKKGTKKEMTKTVFILGGIHTFFSMASRTNQLYLTRRTEVEGDKTIPDGYLAGFSKETGWQGFAQVYERA